MNETKFVVHEMPDFAKWVRKNRLREAVERVKAEIVANPNTGDVIPGGSGLRKIRMAGHGRGKNGGFRVIYVLFLDRTAALLLDGYSKSVKADLSADEVQELIALQSLIVADLTALSQGSKSEGE